MGLLPEFGVEGFGEGLDGARAGDAVRLEGAADEFDAATDLARGPQIQELLDRLPVAFSPLALASEWASEPEPAPTDGVFDGALPVLSRMAVSNNWWPPISANRTIGRNWRTRR